jgi:putative tryptophan/tyrosine transport system substrate-binding protein
MKKILCVAVCAMLFALWSVAEAQQPKKVHRIGYLESTLPSGSAHLLEVFRQRMRDLGWIEGKNVAFEYRFAEDKGDKYLKQLAAELVQLKVDIIVTRATSGALAAKQATNTIPIVMVNVADPVAAELVTSLARPGGNITGLTQLAPELGGKRLELLKETVPSLARVATLGGSGTSAGQRPQRKEIEIAARALGVQLQSLKARGPEDFEPAFQAASGARADALIVEASPRFFVHRRKIVEHAAKNRLPAIYPESGYVEAGGLMSYATSSAEMYRRAATYVDKILKGTKPADLPVEQPRKFEFIINLKTAKQIGLTIPPNVLARADKVIK